MVLYGPLLSCLVPYGPVWLPMVTYGHLWSPMVPYGLIWSRIFLYGHVWSRTPMVTYSYLWSRPVVSCMVPYPACPKKYKLPACPKRDTLPTCPKKQVDIVLSQGFHKSPYFRGIHNSSMTMPLSIRLQSQLGPHLYMKSSINSQKVVFRCSFESFPFIEVNPLWEEPSPVCILL